MFFFLTNIVKAESDIFTNEEDLEELLQRQEEIIDQAKCLRVLLIVYLLEIVFSKLHTKCVINSISRPTKRPFECDVTL